MGVLSKSSSSKSKTCFLAGSWKVQEHQQTHFCSFLQMCRLTLKSVYSFFLLVCLFSIYSFLVLTSEGRYLVLLEICIPLRSLCVGTPIPTVRHRIPFLLHTLIKRCKNYATVLICSHFLTNLAINLHLG